ALISPWYHGSASEAPGRLVSVLFGLGTVVLVYFLGRILYTPAVGGIAALLVGVMPYHVIVTRQILLDGPETFFTTAALVCLAKLGRDGDRRWMMAAAAYLGMATLTKETALVFLGSFYLYISLVPRLWSRAKQFIPAIGVVGALVLLYPLSTALAGGRRGGQSYLLWQLSRRPNHSVWFYFEKVPVAMGVLVVLLAALALLSTRRSWRELLLMSWIVVPVVFFELWPVKGFQYLLPTIPAVAVLAAAAIATPLVTRHTRKAAVRSVLVAACVCNLLLVSVPAVAQPAASGLAGGGGTVGGREVGRWLMTNAPAGARVMTIGPSMANVVQYYSGHRADGLSVSPDPLHRNPSYAPVLNPDNSLRRGDFQYVVWDIYSAKRSPTFAKKLLALSKKHNGRIAHRAFAGTGPQRRAVIVVYEVHP
ncbi:MAG: ArnT family glycosyltransferase, partial [Actinomycetes bacterium]